MRRLVLALVLSGVLGACSDAVREELIDAQGPEVAGVPEGPLHRAGQRCGACHDGRGRAPEFALAGTVYQREGQPEPAVDVTVRVVDSTGAQFESVTNCVGNFYIFERDFSPSYPVWVSLAAGDVEIRMESPIRRESACAACHQQERGADSTGPVFLLYANSRLEAPAPQQECP